MRKEANLSRWNRAGLERFRYLDANGATLLEDLRVDLMIRLLKRSGYQDGPWFDPAFWERVQKDLAFRNQHSSGIEGANGALLWRGLWRRLDEDGENDQAWAKRLIDQFRLGKGDLGWETARTFSKSLHVLTETIDAYANEGFLETAVSRRNLQRLLAMIGYQPVPPASATSYLALLAKGDVKVQTITPGLQVKGLSGDGENIVFETLDELELDPALNGLRLKGWRENPIRDSWPELGGQSWPVDKDTEAGAGDAAMIVAGDGGEFIAVATLVKGVAEDEDGNLLLTIEKDNSSSLKVADTGNKSFAAPAGSALEFPRSDTRLYLEPGEIRSPRIAGKNALLLDRDPGLMVGQTVAWKVGGNAWSFDEIVEIDGAVLRLRNGQPTEGFALFRALPIEKTEGGAALLASALDEIDLEGKHEAGRQIAVMQRRIGQGEEYRVFSIAVNRDDPDIPVVAVEDIPQSLYYVHGEMAPAGFVRSVPAEVKELIFGGKPGAMEAGQWLIVERPKGARFPSRIKTLDEREKDFTLTLEFVPDGFDGDVELVFAAFGTECPRRDRCKNTSELTGSDLELAQSPPEGLEVGHQILLEELVAEDCDDPETVSEPSPVALLRKVRTVNRSAAGGKNSIELDQPLEAADGLTIGGAMIRANVVRAGHGEIQSEDNLGSGVAGAVSQTFLVKETEVSRVADASMAAGVRADIEIKVSGRAYRQIDRLDGAGPADPVYEVRQQEDGSLLLAFGDGEHGRRLPVGEGNIRCRLRKGVGAKGVLSAGRLVELARKHPAIEEVRQPMASSGGQDAESLFSLREHAAPRLFTLGRAVSLGDFERLAESQSVVWQASAYTNPANRARSQAVEVVVVPAGGGSLGPLRFDIEKSLSEKAQPGVSVTVSGFEPIPLHLNVTVFVNSAEFDKDQVAMAVNDRLVAAFDLSARRIGGNVSRAEIFALAEAQRGVSYVQVTIPLEDASGHPVGLDDFQVRRRERSVRVLKANRRQVIYHVPGASEFVVSPEEAKI